ncbi:uncharacterized protein LOC129939872 [Eupeodes corollae]|uniref:uncharacterized protein LOC129939872 n=1 Tax=Eupeodes corollae TaxID=290404 RepID=UPI00249131C7|nr:uncharacterized protein LOC129939872 [Eupeodes corollae]
MSLFLQQDTKEIITDIKVEQCDFLPRLISLVQQNPILYEKSNKYYYNRHKKEKVWRDIAALTNTTALECKNKWTALREKFIREQKKLQRLSSTGTAPEHEWELYREMSFLKHVTTPRKKMQTLEIVEIIECPRPSTSSSPIAGQTFPTIEECLTPSPLRKKSFDGLCDQFGLIINKLDNRLEAEPQNISNSDADELFIRTAVSMIEKLPSSVKDDIKSDIFNKIIEARKRFRDIS